MAEGHIKAGGGATPDTLCVRLVWWKLPSTAADLAWGKHPPQCGSADIEVLGVWSPRRTYFTVHAVLPKEPLPSMNRSAQTQFVRAAKKTLAEHIEVNVHGLSPDIVEWKDPYEPQPG
tara:strand:- start:101 stop:454 length:354 start_codon:yes stop_codon:yes gene_type:complete